MVETENSVPPDDADFLPHEQENHKYNSLLLKHQKTRQRHGMYIITMNCTQQNTVLPSISSYIWDGGEENEGTTTNPRALIV